MNPLSIFKYGAGALIVLGAYFFGLNQGHNSEQLKNARSQISQLIATVQNYETQYKNQAIALAELRIAESSARNDGATESTSSKIELKPLQLETQFNASDWNKRVDSYFLKQDRLLTTVEGHLAGNSGAGDK